MGNQGQGGMTPIAVGSAAPAAVLDNAGLERMVDTSDEWIASRTGIRCRHVAAPGESLTDLAATAARRALEMGQVSPDEIDLVILATSTPDDLFGSAARVQAAIGATQAVAFDLTAACSGFVFGMVTAAQFLRTGAYRTVLLIGADVLSRWVDWDDRRTCILFGDGAGAVVLRASDRDGLLGFEMRSDGTQNSSLTLNFQDAPRSLLSHDGGDLSVGQGTYQTVAMNGPEVYRFAVRRVPEAIEKALFRAGRTAEDIDWLLLHQANQRIVDAVAQRLKLPPEKVLGNLSEHGNTSAASIPLALDAAVRDGRVQPGHAIATAGFGAGLSWGAAVFEWGGP